MIDLEAHANALKFLALRLATMRDEAQAAHAELAALHLTVKTLWSTVHKELSRLHENQPEV